ncbi:MAG: tyrosine-protein phosphatase [Nevskia sp.]|nr:tyrosine-protein phosphatase [Nevskia sp.]
MQEQSLPAAPPRRLPLTGAVNFRDIGGYRTADGRTTAWRRLFRSDSLSELTAEDVAAVDALGLRTICDLRHDNERRLHPDVYPTAAPVTVHAFGFFPYGTVEMIQAANEGRITPAEARGVILEIYRRFPHENAGTYRQMFDILLAQDALPALIHCTSGKDRTGYGTAMVLLALGVPREIIVEDYLLSDRYRRNVHFMFKNAVDPSVLAAITAANSEFLNAAFGAIDDRWGGEDKYLRDELGVDEPARERLRELLLVD